MKFHASIKNNQSKIVNYLIIAFFYIFSVSCTGVLDKTIFIPDETYPELPAYSEWGYNSFGAYYERNVFISTNDIIPCKIVYNNGVLNFLLSGKVSSEKMILTFSFPLSEVKTIADLAVLHNKTLDLTENCTVKMEIKNAQTALEVSSGSLHFKRFQLLNVDEKFDRIILSGTFDVKFLKNGLPETVSNGRFDLGITNDNFNSNAK